MEPTGVDPIFHIALRSDWDAARHAGEYRVSTRGASLDAVGYIHASFRHQVERTAAAFYADVLDAAVVLVLDPARLDVEIRAENLEGGTELFPHLYGPVPVAAVVAELGLTSDRAGQVTVPGLAEV